MTNLRDIINGVENSVMLCVTMESAVKQAYAGRITCVVCGREKHPVGRSGGLMSASMCRYDCDGYHQDPQPISLWWNEQKEMREYIDMLTPDHTLLIEEFIDAFVADEEQQTTLSEVSVYTAFNALAAYREERGYNG